MITKRVQVCLIANDKGGDDDVVALVLNSSACLVERFDDSGAALEQLLVRGAGSMSLPTLVIFQRSSLSLSDVRFIADFKADERLSCIPLLVLSSSREKHAVRSAYWSGANAYIVDPMTPAERAVTLQAALDYWLSVNEYCTDRQTHQSF